MKAETFIATIKHDNETIRLKVVSLHGKQGAIQQITTAEDCPESAIMDIVKIDNDKN